MGLILFRDGPKHGTGVKLDWRASGNRCSFKSCRMVSIAEKHQLPHDRAPRSAGDVVVDVPDRGSRSRGRFEPTIVKMLQFLAETRAPDGCWPMVNDSVPDYPIDPTALVVAGALLWKRRVAGPPSRGNGSYHAWLTGRSVPDLQQRQEDASPVAPVFTRPDMLSFGIKVDGYLFFDAGPMGSERMQGHGHADALSFILYGRGRPLVIDPGVYSYHEKASRDHFRSTEAHNTVTVDHQDQCLFWGPFRVAYPPKVRLLEWSQRRVLGEHEGYCRLRSPVLHRRSVERKAPGEWEVNDRFEGSGEHDLALTLQFSSGAKSDLSGLNGEVRWPEGDSIGSDLSFPCCRRGG